MRGHFAGINSIKSGAGNRNGSTAAGLPDGRSRRLQAIARLGALLACALLPAALAQGVTDTEILLGQTAGFTGPVADISSESTAGARLYFDWINAQGGVNGRKIVLESRDDRFNPKQAAENVKAMIETRPPIAFIITRGTPQTEAVLPALKAAGIPLIAPGTGAEIFHQPVNPLVFNLRAKNRVEIAKAVEHMASTGINRIALIHVNDSFGADSLAGFGEKMGELKLTPVLVTSFDRTTGDTAAAIAALGKANPQVAFVVGSTAHISGLINKARAAGIGTQFVTMSNNSAKGFVKALGANARGVMVVQGMPNPRSSRPIAREMARLAKDQKDFVSSQPAIEGFAAAKLTVEALRRAGKKPTPRGLIDALESMKDVDLGGIEINYSRTSHTGGDLAEMSIIDARGEFLQ